MLARFFVPAPWKTQPGKYFPFTPCSGLLHFFFLIFIYLLSKVHSLLCSTHTFTLALPGTVFQNTLPILQVWNPLFIHLVLMWWTQSKLLENLQTRASLPSKRILEIQHCLRGSSPLWRGKKKPTEKPLRKWSPLKKPTIQQPRGDTQPNTHPKTWGQPFIVNPFLEPVMHHLTY